MLERLNALRSSTDRPGRDGSAARKRDYFAKVASNELADGGFCACSLGRLGKRVSACTTVPLERLILRLDVYHQHLV